MNLKKEKNHKIFIFHGLKLTKEKENERGLSFNEKSNGASVCMCVCVVLRLFKQEYMHVVVSTVRVRAYKLSKLNELSAYERQRLYLAISSKNRIFLPSGN